MPNSILFAAFDKFVDTLAHDHGFEVYNRESGCAYFETEDAACWLKLMEDGRVLAVMDGGDLSEPHKHFSLLKDDLAERIGDWLHRIAVIHS